MFARFEIYQKFKEIGFVPIFNTPEKETAAEIVKNCVQSGATIVELTDRNSNSLEVFNYIKERSKQDFPSAIIGIGSITDPSAAALFINAGVDFIVGPNFDQETAQICNQKKIPYIPGCGTISEIKQAEKMGVEICKVFPADAAGGPEFIRAALAPSPKSNLMPTGKIKIDRESIEPWFEAGAFCIALGSNLISKDIIKARNFSLLDDRIRSVIQIIQAIRQNN